MSSFLYGIRMPIAPTLQAKVMYSGGTNPSLTCPFHRSCTGSCGGLFTAPAGCLLTPNYPASYPANLLCRWTVAALPGYVVRLDFADFKTRAGQDVVRVCNGSDCSGTIIAQLSGTLSPAGFTYISLGEYLSVEFQTGPLPGETGFHALYRIIQPSFSSDILTPSSIQFTSSSDIRSIQASSSSDIPSIQLASSNDISIWPSSSSDISSIQPTSSSDILSMRPSSSSDIPSIQPSSSNDIPRMQPSLSSMFLDQITPSTQILSSEPVCPSQTMLSSNNSVGHSAINFVVVFSLCFYVFLNIYF